MKAVAMLTDFIRRAFDGRREVHARLDEAIQRSEAARKKASEVCATIEIDANSRASVDWGPSFAALERAQAENPLADVRLPAEVDGVPSPETEAAARERDRRILFPDQE